jgi:hypothetical protein
MDIQIKNVLCTSERIAPLRELLPKVFLIRSGTHSGADDGKYGKTAQESPSQILVAKDREVNCSDHSRTVSFFTEGSSGTFEDATKRKP